ncbi:VOC family protein [Ornithinimicrobium panacihumi]|uniref:VOC family protein n=1 Tax=Ornithinimicrobium panacihumi TaxID=2008449 RepID=UPI003F8CE278
MQDARICLWRNDDALEVATFYTELFDDAEIQEVRPAVRPEDADLPAGRGVGVTVDFRVGPLLMQTLNGGDDRDYDESMSVAIITEDQAETDRVWEALIADGGREDGAGGASTATACAGRSSRER